MQIQAKPNSRSIRDTLLRCVLDRRVDPQLGNLAFGFRVIARKNGTDDHSFLFEPSREAYNPRGLSDARVSEAVVETSLFTIEELRSSIDWTFEIRGDAQGALCDWERTAYWDGAIILNAVSIRIDPP